jgi:hypothetical protein
MQLKNIITQLLSAGTYGNHSGKRKGGFDIFVEEDYVTAVTGTTLRA